MPSAANSNFFRRIFIILRFPGFAANLAWWIKLSTLAFMDSGTIMRHQLSSWLPFTKSSSSASETALSSAKRFAMGSLQNVSLLCAVIISALVIDDGSSLGSPYSARSAWATSNASSSSRSSICTLSSWSELAIPLVVIRTLSSPKHGRWPPSYSFSGVSSMQRYNASVTWLFNPCLYWTVKSNAEIANFHRYKLPCGSLKEIIHLSASWSDRTTNSVPSLYGMRFWIPKTNYKHYRSVALYRRSVSVKVFL